MKKHIFLLKKFLTLFSFVFIFLNVFTFVDSASGPVKYNWEIGLPFVDVNQINDFGSFVMLIIKIAFWLAILFAFYKLIEIGFKYMVSRGNADAVAYVSASFKNVLIGLLILFGAYIILYTINPDLISIPDPAQMTSLPGGVQSFTAWRTNLDAGVQWTTLLAVNSAWKNTADSRNAANDLTNGKASYAIEQIIASMLDSRDQWLGENCSSSVEFGPIVTGHYSDPNHPQNSTYKGPRGDGKSCHQTGHAVDLVIFEKNSPNTPSVECMKKARTWILQKFSHAVKVCDETNILGITPHIHIEDLSCPIGPSC